MIRSRNRPRGGSRNPTPPAWRPKTSRSPRIRLSARRTSDEREQDDDHLGPPRPGRDPSGGLERRLPGTEDDDRVGAVDDAGDLRLRPERHGGDAGGGRRSRGGAAGG